VGFYSEFVRTAIEHLSSHSPQRGAVGKRDPCIAVITNALPSQFWIWMREGADAGYYKPVAEYLKAQFDGAEQLRLKVFRTILVGPSALNEDPSQRSKTASLWSRGEWERQKPWSLVLTRSQPVELLTTSVPLPLWEEYMVPYLAWTKKDEPLKDESLRNTCWVINKIPDPKNLSVAEAMKSYMFRTIWSYYCEKLHYVNVGSLSGATEIFEVNGDVFTERPPVGFNGCPDLMFLGRCSQGMSDVWDSNGEQPEWEIALMTTMSPRTQTMFLTLVYDLDRVNQLWQLFRDAKARLGEPIASSADGEVNTAITTRETDGGEPESSSLSR
jgi:hypothetical protein